MKKLNRFSMLALTTSLLMLGAGCSTKTTTTRQLPPSTTPPSQEQPVVNRPAPSIQKTIAISGFSFQPSTFTVTAGTSVTWKNNDSTPHTITADDGTFDSGPIAQGASFSHTFATAGTVAYHCGFHPSMHGSVTGN